MADFLHIALAGFRLASFIGTTGAIFAFGIICACKWLKWSPINVTVHLHNNFKPDGEE